MRLGHVFYVSDVGAHPWKFNKVNDSEAVASQHCLAASRTEAAHNQIQPLIRYEQAFNYGHRREG